MDPFDFDAVASDDVLHADQVRARGPRQRRRSKASHALTRFSPPPPPPTPSAAAEEENEWLDAAAVVASASSPFRPPSLHVPGSESQAAAAHDDAADADPHYTFEDGADVAVETVFDDTGGELQRSPWDCSAAGAGGDLKILRLPPPQPEENTCREERRFVAPCPDGFCWDTDMEVSATITQRTILEFSAATKAPDERMDYDRFLSEDIVPPSLLRD